ncbi:hypothetical protein MRX96_049450 [Rhipicephalus microplus]
MSNNIVWARVVQGVTCSCLGWNVLALFMRNQPWFRENFGVLKSSATVGINVISDFAIITNIASDILLIWIICYSIRDTDVDTDTAVRYPAFSS